YEEIAASEEEIKQLAYHDHLTGLPNLRCFNEQLNHAINLANRTEKMFTIMFLDLDSFKMINDTMGHNIGDKLLKQVAQRLVDTLRKSDVLARIGGDEFIVMLENIKDENEIKTVAEKILGCFTQPFLLNDQEVFVTTSIGIAVYPTDGNDADKLKKNADIAMYKAKQRGKNQYVFCTPGMKTKIIRAMKLTNDLYRALERNEFELYYQPQVNCNTNEIVGLEALIRWNHAELGMVYPGEFIPIAEQNGLIISIGEWVMRTACWQNKAWQEAGYSPIRIGVNLSVQQLQDANIVNQVKDILRETDLDPEYVELEITESIAMTHKRYVETINALKDLGVKIAIDDFGTQYSSLNYLKRLSVDRIKIAMPFIQGISENPNDEAITKTIITLARSMGIDVIAEGVETINQL
ncbi:MAG: EAL domain-containing protein, partial [Bacillota bacterium]